MRICSVLLVLCLTMACNDEDLLNPDGQGPPALATVNATISNTFNPTTVTIAQGGQVRYQFGATGHTVIFEKVAGAPPDIVEVSANKTENRTFDVIGTFIYECDQHQGMQGTVIVAAASD